MILNKTKNHEHEETDESQFAKVIKLDKNIYIFGEINPATTGFFLNAFTEADSTPGVITIHICSMGGWVEGGMSMYDTIKASKNVVKTVACGAVYSSAVLPFVAGDIRVAQRSSRFLLHQMSLGGVNEINLTTVKTIATETTRLHKLYCEYVSNASLVSTESVATWCESETYLSAEEANKYGIVQKVIEFNPKKYVDLEKRLPLKKSRKKAKK